MGFFKKVSEDVMAKKEEALYTSYRKGASKRGYSFDLSKNNFIHLINSNCHFCGDAPTLDSRGMVRNGIDRIDNSIGYIRTNVATCCASCNRMKGTLSIAQFTTKIDKITKTLDSGMSRGMDPDNMIVLYDAFKRGKMLPFYNLMKLVRNGIMTKDEVKYDVAQTVYEFKKDSMDILNANKELMTGKQHKKLRKGLTLDFLYETVKQEWSSL